MYIFHMNANILQVEALCGFKFFYSESPIQNKQTKKPGENAPRIASSVIYMHLHCFINQFNKGIMQIR